MHIAIEGIDGVGKTETARLLAQKRGFTFIEKPLHYILDKEGMENYLRTTQQINNHLDHNFAGMFYGLGNYYLSKELLRQKGNVVTDRHLCSTYFWNKDADNERFFDYLVEICGLPNVTILLFADQQVRQERISRRNPNDPDLLNKVLPNNCYDKMLAFLNRYHAPYHLIDNSHMTLEETVDRIDSLIGEYYYG